MPALWLILAVWACAVLSLSPDLPLGICVTPSALNHESGDKPHMLGDPTSGITFRVIHSVAIRVRMAQQRPWLTSRTAEGWTGTPAVLWTDGQPRLTGVRLSLSLTGSEAGLH